MHNHDPKYVIGLDYGTDSVRALLVNAHTGEEIETAVHYYERWKAGKYCDAQASRFRQHPLDYIEGMEAVIETIVAKQPASIINCIVGISVDTTGSTPGPVDENGMPLALLPEFAENPNAMFILWKDHTAIAEAEEINALSHRWETDYTKYSGGLYSSEWFWAKILHTLRIDDKVAGKAFSWTEHCDWIPALLTGNTNPLTFKRSRCAAGHKALWNKEFGGLPSEEFLSQLDPLLSGLRSRLYTETYTADQSAGTLSAYWARQLGLPEHVTVGVGALDAHVGAVGSCITPYTMVKVMGTSTCDMLIAPGHDVKDMLINGICGQADGSIIPGMIGFEAGQSAFGDLYNWFQQVLEFPLKEIIKETNPEIDIEKAAAAILPKLSEKAATLPLSENDIVALDWINGRRTPDVDMKQKTAIYGLHLGSLSPQIFKALVEATAFGSRAIADRFKQEGMPVKSVISLGGIAKKSAFVMQTLANVLNIPIAVVSSEQTCALGAAMFSATVSGVFPDIAAAQQAMSSGFDTTYFPDAEKVIVYDKLYKRYCNLGLSVNI